MTEHHITHQTLCIGIDILLIANYIGIEQIYPVCINRLELSLSFRHADSILSSNCQETRHKRQKKREETEHDGISHGLILTPSGIDKVTVVPTFAYADVSGTLLLTDPFLKSLLLTD